MAKLVEMISEEEIKKKIKETAAKISQDYKDKEPLFIGVLKGSFVFLADLTRRISIDHEIDFIGTSSYEGSSSTGRVKLTKEVSSDPEGRHVILVEDIVDTGRTLKALKAYLDSLGPFSIKFCTLVDKCERREVNITVDYACFSVKKGFVVGYGLDYNEKYRNLSAIYDLKL